jgi:hypothetical protein
MSLAADPERSPHLSDPLGRVKQTAVRSPGPGGSPPGSPFNVGQRGDDPVAGRGLPKPRVTKCECGVRRGLFSTLDLTRLRRPVTFEESHPRAGAAQAHAPQRPALAPESACRSPRRPARERLLTPPADKVVSCRTVTSPLA